MDLTVDPLDVEVAQHAPPKPDEPGPDEPAPPEPPEPEHEVTVA